MKSQTTEYTSSFDSMRFDELLMMRERLDRVISKRVSAEEKDLEERLARLKRLKGSPSSSDGRGVDGVSRKLPIKYRNPDNPTQVWAGRGLQPHWLKRALKSGRKLADFIVLGSE